MNTIKIKAHIKKHKMAYAVATTAVSVAGITWLIMRDNSQPIRRTIGVPAQGTIGALGEKVVIKDSTLNTVSYFAADRRPT